MILAFLALGACSPAMMSKMREDVDRQHLGEAVDLYWRAAKWGDAAVISTFLVEPADQLAAARVIATPVIRVTDTKVLQVVVGPELVARKARDHADLTQRWREGTALVKVETYGLNNDRVVAVTEEQQWVMDARGWHVDTARSPIDPDRPW